MSLAAEPLAPAVGSAAKLIADGYIVQNGGDKTPKRLIAPNPPKRVSSLLPAQRGLAGRAPTNPQRTTTNKANSKRR